MPPLDASPSAADAEPPVAVLPPAPPGPVSVRVWDPFVRVFHWSLVGLVAAAFLTGDEATRAHELIGFAVAALVAARIVWGFVGGRHARFADFVRPPGVVLRHLVDTMRLRAPRVLGHNPAGGAMILALLSTLIAVSATGFMMTTDAFWGEEWVEDLHAVLVYGLIGLVVLHVTGVVVAGIEHGENLVRAMITGRKRPL